MRVGVHRSFFSTFAWRFFFLVWLGVFGAQAAVGQNVTVTAAVSQTVVSVGARLDYTITITARGKSVNQSAVKAVKMPQFVGLSPMSKDYFSSSQTTIVNRTLTSTYLLTRPLMAQKEGTALVTEGSIVYEGKPYKLPEIQVKVVKEQVDALPADLKSEGVLSAQSNNANINKEIKNKLFARLVISNKNPYLQESITVDCVIYSDGLKARIPNADWSAPEWKGFFAQKIKQQNSRWGTTKLPSGKTYETVTIGRYLLIPQKTGVIEIPLHAARCSLRVPSLRRSSSSFEDRFFNFNSVFDRQQPIAVSLPLAARKIEVKPLPTQGRPPSFQAAVGRFSFAANVDRSTMTEDDFLTLRCEVGGVGFLGSITEPQLPEHPDWTKIGKPLVKTDSAKTAGSLGGKKTFEYVLRPKRAGTLAFPAIAYAFFDPEQERYIEQVQGPFRVRVAPGEKRDLIKVEGNGAALATGRAPSFFGDKIAHIHTAVPVSALSPPFYKRQIFTPLQVAPILLLVLAVGFRLWGEYVERNRGRLAVRSAGGRARRELKSAGASLKKGDLENFHVQLAEALRGYLATKLDRAASGLTLEEIESACRERGVEAGRVEALHALLERCDRARYLSSAVDPDEAAATFDEAGKMLGELDKTF